MNWNQQVELCVSACECVHVRYFAVEMEMGKTVRHMFFLIFPEFFGLMHF